MKAARKSYSIEFKKKIVLESQGKNLVSFCKDKQLDLRMVRKWRSKFDQISFLEENGNIKKRSVGSGRTPDNPELESLLFDWIVDRRLMSYAVKIGDVQKMALPIAAELEIDKFKASNHWLSNFFNRHHLSLRKSTTLFKLEDEEIVRRALFYKSFIDNIDFSQYDLSHMVAMDETAVYMGETSEVTLVRLPSTFLQLVMKVHVSPAFWPFVSMDRKSLLYSLAKVKRIQLQRCLA